MPHPRPNRRLHIALIAAVISVVTGFGGPRVMGHEFPDGVIERSASYKLRNDQLIIEYSVGLNPQTMKKMLEAWQVELPPLDLPLTVVTTTRGEEATAPTPLTKDEKKVEALFREHAPKVILKNINASCDGTKLPLAVATAAASARHHVNLVVEMTCKFPTNKKTSFRSIDTNFIDGDGTVRYSFKAFGAAAALRCNVEPVLIRADRHDLGKIKEEARPKYTTVEAELVFAKRTLTKPDARKPGAGKSDGNAEPDKSGPTK